MKEIKKIAGYIITAVVFLNSACDQVDKNIWVTGITVDIMSLSMIVGDEQTLTATISPENATNQEMVWTSNNREVASVDENGKVTAISQGEAKISVTSVDGGYRTSCIVSVYNKPIPVTGVALNQNEAFVNKGTRYKLTATVLPLDATDKYITWRSDSVQYVRVTPSGDVEAINVGKSNVTVTTRDGQFRATCVVNVIE